MNNYYELLTQYFYSQFLQGKEDFHVEVLEETLSEVHFKVGDSPIKQGYFHPFAYFILKGAARSFQVNEEKEVNSWFAFEKDIVASIQHYKGMPALETISFLEDSHCLKIDLRKLHSLSNTHLSIAHFLHNIFIEHIEFLEERLRLFQQSPGIDRYMYILEKEPMLLQRVPLLHLASYLGISRETLSRLRAKISL